MRVRHIHRPSEEYSQCQFPKEELHEQPWRGYRESRTRYNGKDASTCMREAQWEVDGKKLCTQHAGIRALEHLEEEGDLAENVAQAMAETAPSWGHRFSRLLSMLGLDFGDGPTTQWSILRDAHRTIRWDPEAVKAVNEDKDWPPLGWKPE